MEGEGGRVQDSMMEGRGVENELMGSGKSTVWESGGMRGIN